MPGEVIREYEYQNINKEEIKQMIEKQKGELSEFILKFNDLENYIREYKEEEI